MDENRTNSDDMKTVYNDNIEAICDNTNSDDMKTVYNVDIKAVYNNTNSDDMKTVYNDDIKAVCNHANSDDTTMLMFQKKNLDSLESLAFDSMIVESQNIEQDAEQNAVQNAKQNAEQNAEQDKKSNDFQSIQNDKIKEMSKTIQKNAKQVKAVKTLPPGTIINSTYQIVRKIAHGGMGVVYEGIDLNIQRRVAIKMILATFGDSKYQTVLQRFINEINATAQLSYQNIVHIYSSGLYQNQPYLVMEYIEGQYINQYVAQNCAGDWKKIAELIYKVAKGLAYIHQHNFLHRDIKPSNILVTKDGEPILIDFGVVKDRNLTIEFTRQGKLIGTLQYMPIEQATGNNKEVDCRSDIYSLGIVLYELLTQKPAYSGTNYAIFQKILHEDPILPRKINPEIPVVLQRITLHAIAKEKKDRYQNAVIFAQALGNYLYPQEIKAPIEERKIQWHFSSSWNLKKKYQYLKKLDILQKRKKRPVHLEKKDSFFKKVIWSIILFLAILSLIIFAYYHFFIEKNYVIFQKENAEKIRNFKYKHTIKYKYIKNHQSEFDVYDYNLIPEIEMPFIYISYSHGDYLLAKEDCKQSTWLRVMGTKPWEGELLQAKINLYEDKQYSSERNKQQPIDPRKQPVDFYDCQEFCHRTHLTLVTEAQLEHAEGLGPFIISSEEDKSSESDKFLNIRFSYEPDITPIKPEDEQKDNSEEKQEEKLKENPDFIFLGIRRFSLEQEAKSVPQYMHKKSHIIFSLVSQMQENGEVSNFLMSVMPCCYNNWDYIMQEQHANPKNECIAVTLQECKKFCQKAGLFLPTDMQWKATCTEEKLFLTEQTDKYSLSEQSGFYIKEDEIVFCKKGDEYYLGIKNEENEPPVIINPISYYKESQKAVMRLVYNLP